MKIKSLAFLAFLIITIFTGCEEKNNIDQSMVVSQNQQETQSEKFNLVTSSGKILEITATANGWKFQGLDGKVILLDFFGTWCPPCKAEIPHLNNVRKKMEGKFEIIGIDIGSRDGRVTPQDKLLAFIKEFNIKYPVTTSGDNGKLFSAVSGLNRGGSIPFMILFDTKGQYVTHYVGMVPEEMLQSDINKALSR
jgi:thiol-disulfide isomerase/thioredoxin